MLPFNLPATGMPSIISFKSEPLIPLMETLVPNMGSWVIVKLFSVNKKSARVTAFLFLISSAV